jgi:hypothetical protein
LEATFERIFGDKGAVAVGWQAALIKRAGNDVLESDRSRRSSVRTWTTSPIN